MFSATAAANFLACHHLLSLDRAEDAGQLQRPFFHDPGLDLLKELGIRHEAAFFRHLVESRGIEIVKIPTDVAWAEAVDNTLNALQSGANAIYQATLQDGPWRGRSDFLIRVSKPSVFGPWSYEPIETKLARSTKAGALIQLCFYSDLLSRIQHVLPDWMHVALASGKSPERYSVHQYMAYFRKIRRDLDLAYVSPGNTYPEPTDHCDVCSWYPVCDKRRRADDHLSLVAGITRQQRKALVASSIPTVAGLANLDIAATPKVEGIGRQALVRIHEQARLQVSGRNAGQIVYELLDASAFEIGLAALPAPSPGDMFVDLEGYPYASEQGLEYLIGVVTVQKEVEGPSYEGVWSLDRAAEKSAFERFINQVMDRSHEHPDMHVYHYAAYEATAIKRLAGQHGICIDEVDHILRAGLFIDLYRVVKQGMRASVESYSIKQLEPLYGFTRSIPLRNAVLSLQTFEAALALGGAKEALEELRATVEGYNRDDCLSAWRLREWLEEQRKELEQKTGQTLSRPAPKTDDQPEELAERVQEVRALAARLMAMLPADEVEWSNQHRAVWLLAQMLEYHRREDKSAWWEYFRQCALSDDELLEDKDALGGLTYVGSVAQIKKSVIHRYRFPPQDHSLDRARVVHDPKTQKSAGQVVDIDEAKGTIDIKRGIASSVPHPAALIPQNIVDAKSQREALLRLGSWVADHGIAGLGVFQAARNLLLRRPSEQSLADTVSLFDERQRLTDVARQLVLSLPSKVTVLSIQGPPGSGKTTSGARMIAELAASGYKVGITAVSHKVISKLLEESCKAARTDDASFKAVQKADEEDNSCKDPMVTQLTDNAAVLKALRTGEAKVVAGTAWLFARQDMAGSVDVLFVDEAGQMSLANVLAISQAATSVVLLGDPQQLDQPQRGIHPPGVDISALAHMLAGRDTIDPGTGIFLKNTWRLHPAICAFTSELFYDGRLAARGENGSQRLNTKGLLDGAGLRFVPVEHAGNQNESAEEVQRIAELISELLDSTPTWTNWNDETVPLRNSDILVVAPYNVQVAALARKLPVGVRVGTVDKFQGQEAPLVFYSMTTSSPEDAPRGMEFLYSLNRLNVATSRARCVAVIVASPALFQVLCKTPRQMKLANALCRYFEMARTS